MNIYDGVDDFAELGQNPQVMKESKGRKEDRKVMKESKVMTKVIADSVTGQVWGSVEDRKDPEAFLKKLKQDTGWKYWEIMDFSEAQKLGEEFGKLNRGQQKNVKHILNASLQKINASLEEILDAGEKSIQQGSQNGRLDTKLAITFLKNDGKLVKESKESDLKKAIEMIDDDIPGIRNQLYTIYIPFRRYGASDPEVLKKAEEKIMAMSDEELVKTFIKKTTDGETVEYLKKIYETDEEGVKFLIKYGGGTLKESKETLKEGNIFKPSEIGGNSDFGDLQGWFGELFGEMGFEQHQALDGDSDVAKASKQLVQAIEKVIDGDPELFKESKTLAESTLSKGDISRIEELLNDDISDMRSVVEISYRDYDQVELIEQILSTKSESEIAHEYLNLVINDDDIEGAMEYHDISEVEVKELLKMAKRPLNESKTLKESKNFNRVQAMRIMGVDMADVEDFVGEGYSDLGRTELIQTILDKTDPDDLVYDYVSSIISEEDTVEEVREKLDKDVSEEDAKLLISMVD